MTIAFIVLGVIVAALVAWLLYVHGSVVDLEISADARYRRIKEVETCRSNRIDEIYAQLEVQKNRNGRLRARIRQLEEGGGDE